MVHETSSIEHKPVMLRPVLGLLNCRPGGRYVDATAGGGGYSEAILDASEPDGLLLALDWDAEAIVRVRERLVRFENRFILENANFANLSSILERLDIRRVDGIVADLGVSTFQLDDPERGFSFIQDGPLDMRMDRGLPVTAADLVNSLPEGEMADLIYHLGEERWSRRIAHAISVQRRAKPFGRTRELAELIQKVVPKTRDSLRIHPATRTFQALRIAVNRELEALQRFLEDALEALEPGGRLCIVAFHSLEDRVVKDRFRGWARKCRCPKAVLRCECSGPIARLLTRKALRPSEEEIGLNPRARSARLRAVEKI